MLAISQAFQFKKIVNTELSIFRRLKFYFKRFLKILNGAHYTGIILGFFPISKNKEKNDILTKKTEKYKHKAR